MRVMSIGGKRIGPGCPLFVVAAIGLNHGGSLECALALVDAAADAGASAVKLQTLAGSDLRAAFCGPRAPVRASSASQFAAGFELDETAHHTIAARARSRRMALIATPLSIESVDLLQRVGVDAFKIGSGDLTFHQLIRRCAATAKPVVISTGMSTTSDVAQAIACARIAGAEDLAILQCVSAYPVPRGCENLRAIATLAAAFQLPVGLSDHASDGFAVPMAVALGASIYERHLMLEGDGDAADLAVSSTPAEFEALVHDARRATAALGSGEKRCLSAEAMNVIPSRRSLRATRQLAAGDVVRHEDVIALRPAVGLSAAHDARLIGRRLTRDVPSGAAFVDADIDQLSDTGVKRDVA
jgi:N,N'-diacetyllegionaminate synthase